VLVVRPASCITGSSRKAGRSHLPLPISTQARRKILSIKPSESFWAAAARLPVSTEVREGDRLVSYQFVTTCTNCSEQFGIVWVMDLTRRVGPKTVARITCPLCGTRFYQDAKDLLQIGSQVQKLVFGRPVRSVEVDYDCPYCSNRGIMVSLLHTDLSWGELSKEHEQNAVCGNGLCPQKGLLQHLKPSRVILGSLNPV
jgi:DNA-directed RNA polymerase subunit RPC12/RpoP